LSLLWQVNKATKLGINLLRINPLFSLTYGNIVPLGGQQTFPLSGSGVLRQGITFDTKGISFAANMAQTDKDFTRASDLALPDADKNQIAAERGFKRTDVTAKVTAIKGLTLDSYFYTAQDVVDQLTHDTHKLNLLYTPNKKSTISYLDESDLTASDNQQNGTTHRLLKIDQILGRGYLLNGYFDETATYAKGVETKAANTDFLHFETPKNQVNGMSLDATRITFQDGAFANTTNLNVHVKPRKDLSLTYSRQEVDRNDDLGAVTQAGTTPRAGVETTDKFDLQWQATKQFAVVAGLSQTDTTDNSNSDVVSIGLKGDPVKNLSVTAKFDELHDTKNTKDTADFSLSNAKPINCGLIKDLTFTARYASLNDQRKLQNETMTGRMAWKLWKNEFVLDYGGLTKPDGTSTISRLYSFTTDPNPKNRFHGSFSYKDLTLATGEEKLVRRFTADWRLDKATSFSYLYGTLPQDEKGNISPITTANISLKHAIRPDRSFEFFYRLSDNEQTRVMTRSLGFGYNHKLSNKSKFSIAYSKDTNQLADSYDRSDHLHFSFDHQFTTENLISLSTEIRSHDKKDLTNEIQTNLDFRWRF